MPPKGIETMKRKVELVKNTPAAAKPGAKNLLTDVRGLILSARKNVAQSANSTLTLLYWEIVRRKDKLTPDLVFRDPYLLDFIGLKDTYLEKDLEAAILREIEAFILELGVGFAFVERQKRIVVDGEDFYLDLLFYHRHLRRLVVIDLKLEEFKPGDAGQMELYLKWLDRYERKKGEEKPIGLILCAGKKSERIELLDLERSGIRVASYWTELLPKKELQRKLHDAVRLARARLAAREQIGGA